MRQQSNDIKKKPKTSIEVNNRPAISQFPISMEYHQSIYNAFSLDTFTNTVTTECKKSLRYIVDSFKFQVTNFHGLSKYCIFMGILWLSLHTIHKKIGYRSIPRKFTKVCIPRIINPPRKIKATDEVHDIGQAHGGAIFFFRYSR